MKHFVSKIWNSPSVRDVGKLLSANVIAQALGLLIYPILTRLYSPDDFGLLSLFMSIGGILILMATADYQNAIVLPKEDNEAQSIVHVSLLLTIMMTIALLLSIPFSDSIANLFKSPDLAAYYMFLPIYVLLMSLWNILNYWYVRCRAYGRISGYQMSQSFFSAGFKSGFGFLGLKPGGLIIGAILSPLCSLIISLLMSTPKHLVKLCAWDWSACRNAAYQYRNFPKYSLSHSLVNTLANQMPVLLLTPFFGSRLVGLWSMAILLSFAPISMITNALYQVLYQKTAQQVNMHQSIINFYRQFFKWSFGIIIPIFAVLCFFLPQITQILLGSDWREAGEYIRWLLPWLFFMYLCASTGYLFNVFSKQKQGLLFEIAIAVGRLIALGFGIYMHSFKVAIACYAIVSAIINAAQYGWLMLLVRKYERTL